MPLQYLILLTAEYYTRSLLFQLTSLSYEGFKGRYVTTRLPSSSDLSTTVYRLSAYTFNKCILIKI